MPILIKRTGLQQYAPGGNARLKVMVIGGPSVGKTRFSSYFPDPIFFDIEGGLASVADREVPYAAINNSRDMADALQHMKVECRKPEGQRQFKTVVIDTLDAYQRKLKNEWMETKRVDSFTGWEAWGFLSLNMGTLMTRLLNLDMNVVVAVHYKDKTTRDDETGRETHEFMLQLSGEIADTAFNDFDFVGWMDEERRVIEGKPQQYRYITFEKTAQKPFLKDRLNVMQGEIPVTFSENDFGQLMSRITARMGDLTDTADVGEIPNYEAAPTANVVTPEQTGASAIATAATNLETLDKVALTKIAKTEGVTHGVDGKPLRGNSLKSEIIEAIKWKRDKPKAPLVTPPATINAAPTPEPAPEPAPVAAPYREAVPAQTITPPAPQPSIKTPVGRVNPGTGEILTPENPEDVLKRLSADYAKAAEGTDDKAIATAEAALEAFSSANPDVASASAQKLVENNLGGVAIARTQPKIQLPDKPAPAPTTPAPAAGHKYAAETCKMCGKSLAGEPFQPIQLGWIKFRALLCEQHFVERRDAGK